MDGSRFPSQCRLDPLQQVAMLVRLGEDVQALPVFPALARQFIQCSPS